jgi:CubicO group peptidase (beta-lactamase class C family)
MTAADLATYAKALAAGELFQNPETLAEMVAFDPAANLSLAPYGLGLLDFTGDGTVWGHGGQTVGFQSLWLTKPEDGLVVVGLTNSATYNANDFINVLHILEGEGAQPIVGFSLLPVGAFVPTKWAWTQFVTPVEKTNVDEAAGLNIEINKDGSVIVNSADCDQAFGAYTSTGMGNISFDIDASSLTCAADSPAGQFVQYLNQATSWSFNNGSLIIELPADGGSLVFKYIPFQ